MTPEDWIAIVGIFICTVVLAFAEASEAALNSISRVRLRQLAERQPQQIERLNTILDARQSHISGAELTAAIALLVASALIGRTAAELADRFSTWLISILAAALVLLLGLVLPRVAASYNPEQAAIRMMTPLTIMRAVGEIVLIPFIALSRLLLRLTGRRQVSRPSGLEEEVLALFSSEDETQQPAEEEQEMIESLVEFHATLVREVMVPRPDIIALPADTTLDGAVDTVMEAGYTRLPVYMDNVDDIRGVLHAKDLLRVLHNEASRAGFNLLGIARPALFVPETKKVDDLLREMQQGRNQMAIVFDEFGGTAGLITIEDLLEEIVGEIQDEYDDEEPSISKLSDTEYVIDARVSLDEVNEELGTNWDAEDYDSLGGLLLDRMGRIPTLGDEVDVDGVRVVVQTTEGRRLRKLHITLPSPVHNAAATDDRSRDDPRARSGSHATVGSGATMLGIAAEPPHGDDEQDEHTGERR